MSRRGLLSWPTTLPRLEPDLMYSLLLPLLLAADPGKPHPVASHIDEVMAKHWQSGSIQPADLADDSTFLRRLTLDLAGRIPTVEEAKFFFRDSASDKRA